MSSETLSDLLEALNRIPDSEREQLTRSALDSTAHLNWVPSPGPQTEAYFSKADILLYGGEPGGGKTSLLLGLAYNCHQRSLIMRRQYTDLSAIVDDLLLIHGSRKGFNGSPPPSLRVGPKRLIELGAAARVGDEQHFQGNPHDFIGFDEATQFAESQIRFLMGWLRSVDPDQRKRVVMATNPPLSAEGAWVVEMFAPWLDARHPNPAQPGELRWFITDEHGHDKEVEGPEPIMVSDRLVEPLSRTFIPASVQDNPYLAGTDYQRQLDAMQEPLRSILLGGFRTSFRDARNQVIPTDWVKQAQNRWKPDPPPNVPMCAIGVDVAAGGDDETILAPRHDAWFAELIVEPGRNTPMGRDVAGLILTHRQDHALIILDMGGGYGGAVFEHLVDNEIAVVQYRGSVAVTTKTRDRAWKFANKRAEAYWRFREALDPGQPGGSRIALPPDPKLLADLTAPVFEITTGGIRLESKEKLVTRLGRSPDRGDAVVMAWSAGPVFDTHGGEWLNQQKARLRGRSPQIRLSRKPRTGGRP